MARRIYLDYASTTPVDKKVLKTMLPFMSGIFGNPSALYQEALQAKKAVAEARMKISKILNIRSEEVVFTGSGTESDNLAVRGVVDAWKKEFKPHIITTNIEHPGILEICKKLQKEEMAAVTYIMVGESGIVSPLKIKDALKPTTVLVTVMLANNEIGTIQPLREISRMIAEYKKSRADKINLPYLHTDASQAANYLDLSFQKLGVDMMTLDASKIYGPKGVGLLAVRRQVSIASILQGGGQEKGLRPGTENVSGIVGMAEALAMAENMRDSESSRLCILKDYFIENVIKGVPGVIINGDIKERLPNNINFCVPGIDAEFAVIKLDTQGIAASAASACLNLSEEPYSYVIDALDQAASKEGVRARRCRNSSLRFTMGRATTKREIDLTLRQLASIMITQ